MGEKKRSQKERKEGRKEGQKKKWEGGREEVKKEGRHSRRKAGMSDGKMDIVITKWGVWGDLLTNVFLSPKLIKINRIN